MALILAFGAFLKNTASLFDTDAPHTVRWSAVHGDLSDPDACVALRDSVSKLLAQAAGRIDAVAHDLHPDVSSTHLALQTAHELQIPAIAVQHHHAHIASVSYTHLDVYKRQHEQLLFQLRWGSPIGFQRYESD